jgi:hypothetical protein
MRTPVILLKWLGGILPVAIMAASGAGADNVAAHYHFAGAADLSRQTNFAATTKLLNLETSVAFKRLVVDRFSSYLATGLPMDAAASSAPLRPLVEDCFGAESVGSFGGAPGGLFEFVLALHLDAARSQIWDENLAKVCQRPGEKLSVANAHGLSWGKGAATLWLLHAGDWLLVGRGTDLQAIRDDFLAQIQKQGRPAPDLAGNFIEADVDWARLEQWLPISFGALKPARTKIELTATRDQIFRMTAQAIYPEAISWSGQPWKPPLKLVTDPLISFTAARDLSPFLAEDIFSGISDDPFPNQFYCWAMAQMPFQNYMAWPVADATNEMRRLSKELPAAFEAKLKTLNDSTLHWAPKQNQIIWNSPWMRMIAPLLGPARSDSQSYLFGELFPLGGKHISPPPELFAQFEHGDNIVYYDWEVTGRRLEQWRLLSELLPIVHKITPAEALQERKAMTTSTNAPKSSKGSKYLPSFVVADNWLNSLASHLTGDTTTEITKTGPAELTIKRRSPFLFTGIELELLTHWMSHAPSVGHIDPQLLPPPAKVTGPGMPSH